MTRHMKCVTIVICPGAVETELTPPVMRLVVGVLSIFRAYLPGFNITTTRGTHVLLQAATASSDSLLTDVKYVSWAGNMQPTSNGFWPSTQEEQERMYALCQSWMQVWKANITK
jgi:hypothetical protein